MRSTLRSGARAKAFPGFSGIYMLEESGGSRAFRGAVPWSIDEFAVTRAERRPRRAVEVRWAMGGKLPSDVIRTDGVVTVIVHDRVVAILGKGGFSGWKTYSVEIFGKDGKPILGYQGLAVPGRCGPINNRRAVRFNKRYPAGLFPAWRGLYFDPAKWDGSDLFMSADGSGHLFVVDAVKRAFRKAKVKNVEFQALDALELDYKVPLRSR